MNVRPSLSRTDDGMGLFVHIAVNGRPGGGAICTIRHPLERKNKDKS